MVFFRYTFNYKFWGRQRQEGLIKGKRRRKAINGMEKPAKLFGWFSKKDKEWRGSCFYTVAGPNTRVEVTEVTSSANYEGTRSDDVVFVGRVFEFIGRRDPPPLEKRPIKKTDIRDRSGLHGWYSKPSIVMRDRIFIMPEIQSSLRVL